MATQTEPKRIGDLILNEFDPRLTRDSVTFRQTSGVTASFKIGQTLVISSAKHVPAAGTTWNSILLANLDDVADSTDVTDVPVLVRGPAIINQDELEWDAGADATDQAAQIVLMLADGIRCVTEPTESSTADE